MSQWFSVGIYGQSGLAMDTFALNDPFTQQLPVKITNNWSGTIWLQGQLNSGTFNGTVYTSYSGVSMSGVSAGANATAIMTWATNVSGRTDTSSPITHQLQLGLLAFTSSNYTGALASGTFNFSNTLFNRYSGMIKVFGDPYNNDQPTPTLTLAANGTLVSGQTISYAMSYILSGWESDIGSPANVQVTSGYGTVSLSWSTITGVSQYLIWRWSGNVDITLYSGGAFNSGGFLRPMDLIGLPTTNSFTDSGITAIQASLFRHRNWQTYDDGNQLTYGVLATPDSNTYLSPPASRLLQTNSNFNMPPDEARAIHSYQLNKNLSGTGLLGPFYQIIHTHYSGAQSYAPFRAIYLNTATDATSSGLVIADFLSGYSVVWYRNVVSLGSSGALSASGSVALQLGYNDYQGQISPPFASGKNIDDVFIVAQS